MGIYNRDYLKDDDEGSSWGAQESTRRLGSGAGLMTKKILIVTAIVFVLQLLTISTRDVVAVDADGNSFKVEQTTSLVTDWLSLRGPDVFHGQIWRLLSYAFCHSWESPLHIVFNLLIVWFTGRMLESMYGSKELLAFYIASALFAGICCVATYTLLNRSHVSVVGASGAAMALFAVFTMHYPRMKVMLFGVWAVECRWIFGVALGLDAFFFMGELTGAPGSGPQTAHAAHLGGALFGFLYFRWNMRFVRWWDEFRNSRAVKSSRRGDLRIYSPDSQPQSNLSELVDTILEKISREGEASLTERERNILKQASRELRNR